MGRLRRINECVVIASPVAAETFRVRQVSCRAESTMPIQIAGCPADRPSDQTTTSQMHQKKPLVAIEEPE